MRISISCIYEAFGKVAFDALGLRSNRVFLGTMWPCRRQPDIGVKLPIQVTIVTKGILGDNIAGNRFKGHDKANDQDYDNPDNGVNDLPVLKK